MRVERKSRPQSCIFGPSFSFLCFAARTIISFFHHTRKLSLLKTEFCHVCIYVYKIHVLKELVLSILENVQALAHEWGSRVAGKKYYDCQFSRLQIDKRQQGTSDSGGIDQKTPSGETARMFSMQSQRYGQYGESVGSYGVLPLGHYLYLLQPTPIWHSRFIKELSFLATGNRFAEQNNFLNKRTQNRVGRPNLILS